MEVKREQNDQQYFGIGNVIEEQPGVGGTYPPQQPYLHLYGMRQYEIMNSGSSSPPFFQARSTALPVHSQGQYHANQSQSVYTERGPMQCSGVSGTCYLSQQQIGDVPERANNQANDRRTSNAVSITGSNISATISIYSRDEAQAERICGAVVEVSGICLRSTKAWISTYRNNQRARQPRQSRATLQHVGCVPRRDKGNSNVGNDDPSSSERTERVNGSAMSLSIAPPTDSLLNNISNICNMLWINAQSSRLSVLNVERSAVQNMRALLEWGETVALSDCDEWTADVEGTLWKVVVAGRHLCDWLAIQEGKDAMTELVAGVERAREYGNM